MTKDCHMAVPLTSRSLGGTLHILRDQFLFIYFFVAAGLHHSHSYVGYELRLYHSSRQRQIFNPLSEARDLTRVLMHDSRVC